MRLVCLNISSDCVQKWFLTWFAQNKKKLTPGWEVGFIWICNSEYVMRMQTLIPSFETSSFIIKLAEFWFEDYFTFKFSIQNVWFEILCELSESIFQFWIGVQQHCSIIQINWLVKKQIFLFSNLTLMNDSATSL